MSNAILSSYQDFQPYLNTYRFGRQVKFEKVSLSTQMTAHALARSGAEEGLVVLAEEQSKGKGRLGREWFSPPEAGIWLSLILRPQLPISIAQHLTILAALGLTTAIRESTGLLAHIKWPNDLMINNKKVAGILTEARGAGSNVEYLILGLGINVNLDYKLLPQNIRDSATALSIEAGKNFDRAQLLATILDELELLYDNYIKLYKNSN